MLFYLYVEFGIVFQQRLNRLSDYVLSVAPVSVSANHLAELGSIVSQVVDSDYIVSQSIINLVNRVSDNGASDEMCIRDRYCSALSVFPSSSLATPR